VDNWLGQLKVDPRSALRSCDHLAVGYFVRRDMLGQPVAPVETLWDAREAARLLRKQEADGSWRYRGKSRQDHPEINYDLVETFRGLGTLVMKYGFDRRHPSIDRAVEYVLSCQTGEGDIRGILGNQYMPYYHGVFTELLIRAGYGDDARVVRGLDWLLSMRQDDGGWIIPTQMVPAKEKTRELWMAPPLPPDRSRPHAHLATGMVLRAFAPHREYRHRPEVRLAAERLKARFFQADKYNDRRSPAYWIKFQYPFWWSNLLTALDSLSRIGLPVDEEVERGLQWFVDHQRDDGLWPTGYELAKRREPADREREAACWVGLAVCRMLRRFDDREVEGGSEVDAG
jgi:hypothetical protein